MKYNKLIRCQEEVDILSLLEKRENQISKLFIILKQVSQNVLLTLITIFTLDRRNPY
jgi:hypothetical protein